MTRLLTITMLACLLSLFLTSCEKSHSAPAIQPMQCFAGECVILNPDGTAAIKITRIDQDGNRRVIIYKSLLTWSNDSTFVLTEK